MLRFPCDFYPEQSYSVATGLASAPFALYCSATEANHWLLCGLSQFFKQWEIDLAGQLTPIVRELPWLERQESEPMHQSLQRWSRCFSAC